MSAAAAGYLVCMLSAAAVVALLGSLDAVSGHHAASLPHLLANVAAWMVLAGLGGAWLLFRPVERYLRTNAGPAPAAGLARLPLLSGLWMFALAAASLGNHLAVAHGSWRAVASAGPAMLSAMLLHVAAFAAYIGLFVYFLLHDYLVGVREQLWVSRKVLLPPGRGSLALRLLVGVAAVAAAPALLQLADQPGDRPALAQHALLARAVNLDLLAAGLFTVSLVVLVARSVSRPLRVVLEAMQRVDRGDLASRAPVLTSDELGALAARFNRMLDGLAEREAMRRVFIRFVPEQVAGLLLAERGSIEPQEREASVLFTDIAGFTAIASRLTPREVLVLLNDYFERVAQVVDRHGGVITQFQGDAVLAVFNLPAAQPRHAVRAVAAALEIACLEPRTRAGVGTGRVVGGTVGGGERLGYTVHGDTVNLAARLEELNKELGTRVLIDGRTAELLGAEIELRDRGEAAVRGFAAPVHVFEPLGEAKSRHSQGA